MSNLQSACGTDCSSCQFFKTTCQGCLVLKGVPFWANDHLDGKPCPIFDCSVNKKGMTSCAKCSELPCTKFTALKDPSMSEEEHQKSIEKRVRNLKNLQ